MKGVSFEFGDEWQLELEQRDESVERSPEQRLALAMIAEALEDYRRYAFEPSVNGQRLFDEARSFLFVWRDADWPFSFDNLCDHLKMNADEIRRRLTLWHTNKRLEAIKNNERYSRGTSAPAPSADVGLVAAGIAA